MLSVLFTFSVASVVKGIRLISPEIHTISTQRQRAHSQGDVLVDATPLFAGREQRKLLGKPTMCCCNKESRKDQCILTGWSKRKNKCNRALGANYYKHSNKDRVSARSRCLVRKPEFSYVSRLLGTRDAKKHPKIVSHHPVFDKGLNTLPPVFHARVYLVRHGQSAFNVLMEEYKGVNAYVKGDLTDARLTPKGQDQAVTSQEFFKRQFEDVRAEAIQLVGSLLSRAYDTLLLATHKLWSTWTEADYHIDQVPALMEFGGGGDVNRRTQLLNSAPVRWVDSSLPHGGLLSDAFPAQQVAKHYEALDDVDWLTSDPWQVQSAYPRRSTNSDCDKVADQLDDVILYFQNLVFSGKTHLVVATHSQLIRCFIRNALKRGLFAEGEKVGHEAVRAVWQDGTGDEYDVYENKISNGAVLSFDFRISQATWNPAISNLAIQSPERGFPTIGELTVNIVRGHNLIDKDNMPSVGDVSDPYVVIEFGGLLKVASITIYDDLNPVWNFKNVLSVASAMQVIRISVFDYDLISKDDFMGDVVIPLHDIVNQNGLPIKRRVKLANVEHGEIELDIAYTSHE